jgi:hypothetical protein
MTAQSAERDVKLRAGGAKGDHLPEAFGLAAGAKLYKGSLTAIDTSGNARPARNTSSNSDVIVGFSERTVDNSSGSAGDVKTEGVRRGIIELNNDGSDPVTAASIGRTVYAVDDQTVSAGSNSSARVSAGKFMGFDADSGKPLVEVGV